MSFSKDYYNEKLQKLQQKANGNLQKFINSAFEMVSEATDINERIKEINDLLTVQDKKEVKELPKK